MASPSLQQVSRGYRIFLLVVIVAILPATAYALMLIPTFESLLLHPDVPGLVAVSVGIVGILIFFIFVYKYQTSFDGTFRMRMVLLVGHALLVVLLFAIVIRVGFGMPWSTERIWGSYDCETAARSWIIAVIVVGTLSGLGSLFDAMRVHRER